MPPWAGETPVSKGPHIPDNARNFYRSATHDKTAFDQREWESDTFTTAVEEEKAGRL